MILRKRGSNRSPCSTCLSGLVPERPSSLLKLAVASAALFWMAQRQQKLKLTLSSSVTNKVPTPAHPVVPSNAAGQPPSVAYPAMPQVQRLEAPPYNNMTLNARPSSPALFTRHVHDEPYDPPPWMHNYIEFHNSHVQLRTGAHRNRTSMRWLQWYCNKQNGTRHCGGLADRLKGMMEALILAKVDNRVVFFEEWEGSPSTGAHPLKDYLNPNLVNWSPRPPKVSGKKVTKLETFTDEFGGPRSSAQKTVKKAPCRFHPSASGVRFTGNLLTDEYYLEEPRCLNAFYAADAPEKVSPYPALFWTLFRFAPVVNQQADRLRGPDIIPVHRNFYVAAHVRTGTFASHKDTLPRGATGPDAWDKFAACIQVVTQAIQQRCGGEAPWTYLASDNQHAKDYIVDKVGTTAKVHAPAVDVMHIDLHSAATDPGQAEDAHQATTAYRSVLAEFKILMDATCLIMSDSGFSKLAKLVSQQQPRCAISYDRCESVEKVAKKTGYIPCPSSR